jgi:uncharacterized OsmC-like protein
MRRRIHMRACDMRRRIHMRACDMRRRIHMRASVSGGDAKAKRDLLVSKEIYCSVKRDLL